MKLIRLSALAAATALFASSSYADVPVSDLSINSGSAPTVATTPAAVQTSSAAVESQTVVDSSLPVEPPTVAVDVDQSQPVNSPRAVQFDDTSHMSAQQRIERLERMFNARSQSSIAIRRQLSQLADEVADLNGKIEHQQHQIDQIVQRERDLYQEMDRRFAQVKGASSDSDGSAATLAPEVKPASAGDGQAEYDAAVKLVMEDRQFDKAIPAFEQFLEHYPQSQFVANAHYWLGQLQYTQGNPDKAIEQFKIVVEQFPKSNKVPESLVKLGQVSLQKNAKAEAKSYFEQVISRYPNSTAAGLAKKQLAQLK